MITAHMGPVCTFTTAGPAVTSGGHARPRRCRRSTPPAGEHLRLSSGPALHGLTGRPPAMSQTGLGEPWPARTDRPRIPGKTLSPDWWFRHPTCGSAGRQPVAVGEPIRLAARDGKKAEHRFGPCAFPQPSPPPVSTGIHLPASQDKRVRNHPDHPATKDRPEQTGLGVTHVDSGYCRVWVKTRPLRGCSGRLPHGVSGGLMAWSRLCAGGCGASAQFARSGAARLGFPADRC
jgi:hypothetical protein